jgi:hypothetical protein
MLVINLLLNNNYFNMTLEQSYEAIKAEFVQLSKAIHLGYNTYEPNFIIAADCVRKHFNDEPISKGNKRTRNENQASMALINIIKQKTDITISALYKLMLKNNNNIIYYYINQHKKIYKISISYRNKYNNALKEYNQLT